MIRPSDASELREMLAGQLEYWCRVSIRDLVRLYGFENARELVAIYINDEADRRDDRPLDQIVADLRAVTAQYNVNFDGFDPETRSWEPRP